MRTARTPNTLITTKLYRPVADPGWVARPGELLARLDEGLGRRVTCVSAPAGYGKTTLVVQWLERQAVPCGWLTLDRADSDPDRFLRYLVAAVEGATPHRCRATAALLAARTPPPFAYLVETFVAELAELRTPVIVVLDDYHAVGSDDVHQLVERMVRTMPALLHLFILTREDPPWPLGHWRAQGWLGELRARDLRFSLEEARRFFAEASGPRLSETAIELVHARAEGWVAALRLVALALRDSAHPEQQVRAFSGSDRLVADYLIAEVLAVQPPAIREFLAVTAPLPRFCAALADQLLAPRAPRPAARETLGRLEQENLFLVPLDHERRWYRYHHLFQELLLDYLPELRPRARRAEIARGAAAWFAHEGLIEEALQHWIDGGDLDAAAELLGEHLGAVIDEDPSRRTLSRWLAMFPRGSEHGRLPLLVAHGYLKMQRMDLQSLAVVLAETEGTSRASSRGPRKSRAARFRADVDGQRAFLLYWRGDPKGALRAASRAVDALPPHGAGHTRTLALFYKAGGLALTGRKDEALRILEDAAAEGGAATRPHVAEFLFAAGCIHLYAGEITAADALARQALAVHETAPIADYWLTQVLHVRAVVAYERNRLDEAAADFGRVAAAPYRTNARFYLDALIGLSLIGKARADREQAARHVARARAYALEIHDPLSLRVVDSFEARLALDAGDPEPGVPPEPPATDSTFFWLEVPSLTHAERLLHHPSAEARRAALPFIEQALKRVKACHNVRQAIPFSLVRALALADRGEKAAAGAILAETVRRAERLGLVRTFVDRGSRLAELLRQLAARRGRDAYLRRLLDACAGQVRFGGAGIAAAQEERDGMAVARRGGEADGLSNRELDVLLLLGQRLSNKEIAERLVVSLETARKHTVNLYRKLGVHRRAEAVAVARTRGLLPSK